MLDENEIVEVINIANATVSYRVPELGVARLFQKREVKRVPVKEIRALSYLKGGLVLIKDFLCVRSPELLNELGIHPEPEYYWTEEDIKDLLLNDSLERLKDALEFAPQGIIDYIKDTAVILQINDMSKRQAIFETTGLNITKAIELNNLSNEGVPVPESPEKSRRRVPVSTSTE